MTSDALPHVHKLADGVYAWLGDNGRGVALAAALGGVLADAARGVPEATLPLPFMPVAPIPMHTMAAKVAPLALLGYRWRDRSVECHTDSHAQTPARNRSCRDRRGRHRAVGDKLYAGSASR